YFSFFGLGSSTDKVVISTNADEEAITVMEKALDRNGFKGEYIVQPQSTAELGGKMMAEGKNIEADIITQATYYRSEEHTSELQSRFDLVCRLLLEKKT